MPVVTPEQLAQKADSAYRTYLKEWVKGAADDFFPRALRANLAEDKQDLPTTIRAFHRLKSKSKASRGWGYTIEEHRVDSPDGHGPRPKRIWIETHDDLLRLADKVKHFNDIRVVAQRLRSELPGLESWVVQNVSTIGKYRKSLTDLMAVAKYFVENPIPDCYAQQLPIEVDTKFIAKHESVLKQWLNVMLPPSAIAFDEKGFARRFGLRERQAFFHVHVLDDSLRQELGVPFKEFAAPVRALAALPVSQTTIVVVENRTPLMTIPLFPRAIAIHGGGAGVQPLASLPWLQQNRILYWGDIDAAGLEILSRLRLDLPHIEAMMMDRATLDRHANKVKRGPQIGPHKVPGLSDDERELYEHCVAERVMLEQEKLLQSYVHATLLAAMQAAGPASAESAEGDPPKA